jgi:hypothetical protein
MGIAVLPVQYWPAGHGLYVADPSTQTLAGGQSLGGLLVTNVLVGQYFPAGQMTVVLVVHTKPGGHSLASPPGQYSSAWQAMQLSASALILNATSHRHCDRFRAPGWLTAP